MARSRPGNVGFRTGSGLPGEQRAAVPGRSPRGGSGGAAKRLALVLVRFLVAAGGVISEGVLFRAAAAGIALLWATRQTRP